MPNNPPNKMWSGRFREPLNRTLEQGQRRLLLCTCLTTLLAILPVRAAAQVNRTIAAPQKCSQRAIDKLEAEPDKIRDWSKLQNFYHRYVTCGVEDAEVETGVDTAVVYMLIHQWSSLQIANQLFLADTEFKKFALASLNSTDSTDDLNRIDRSRLSTALRLCAISAKTFVPPYARTSKDQ